ncbi:MAG: MBL fold metallo-hydrolase, partial [Pseudomonadota bacterium]
LSSIDMLKTVRARVQARIDAGDTEDEAVAAAPLKDLEAEWAWGFIGAERMARSVYRSLTG